MGCNWENVHKKMIIKYIFVLFLIISIVGCSDKFAVIENTKIEKETRLKELSKEELKETIALNQSDQGNIFNSAKAVTVNWYRIIYHPGDDAILVVKNQIAIAAILDKGESITVYKNTPWAPATGSQKVIIVGNFISYSDDKYTFEDF
jgi:hypothetical protein